MSRGKTLQKIISVYYPWAAVPLRGIAARFFYCHKTARNQAKYPG